MSHAAGGIPPLRSEMESIKVGKCIIGESCTTVILTTKKKQACSLLFFQIVFGNIDIMLADGE